MSKLHMRSYAAILGLCLAANAGADFSDEFDTAPLSLDVPGDGVNKWHWRFFKW